MIHREVQSLPWRLLAVLMLILATVRTVFEFHSAPTGASYRQITAYALMVVGIWGYAFGWRIGPRLFWRIFAVLFCIVSAIFLGKRGAAEMFFLLRHSWREAGPGLVTFLAVAIVLACSCLALLRNAELVSE